MSEGNYQQNKKSFIEWEKTFANNTSDAGLIASIYKEFMQLNLEKKKKTQQSKSSTVC